MSKTLKQAKVGETVTVQRLQGEGPVKRRIPCGAQNEDHGW